ncbi:MAG: thiamine diphosphokinase [Lachnospiraceae bacterium]
MKKCVIISGGKLEEEFAFVFVQREKPQFLIAADKGLKFCHEKGICPTHIVGDFDTLGEALLPEYEAKGIPIRKFNPVKDATDTEIAVRLAIELGAEEIHVLGALAGNRLDHLFGNVQTLIVPAKEDIPCFMEDSHNRMRVLFKPEVLRRDEQYGRYVSLVPLTTEVKGVSLEGFKYPLTDYTFSVYESASLGISNEITEEEGKICFSEGIFLMLESRD